MENQASMKTLPLDSNFLAIEDQYSSLERSKIAIISAPYEHTVSYGGGTKLGPSAIIAASHFVEFFDEETERELCFEKGIATLEPLDFGESSDEDALEIIYRSVSDLLAQEKFVVTLGGEHTISVAPIRAHATKYPGMSILHFDAHSDLRTEYQGNKFSHASALARALDFFPPEKLVQVGIRAQCKDEWEFIKERGVKTFYAHAIRSGIHGEDWQRNVFDALSDEVYITFDVDYFDPAIMPTTGTPEPGGFFWDETMKLLRMVGKEKRIVGFDVVELAPDDRFPAPTYLTAKLVYRMLNFAFI